VSGGRGVRQITDHYAFALLNGIICHVPPAKFPEFLPVLTSAALERSAAFPAPVAFPALN
jgi:hypothetical protein